MLAATQSTSTGTSLVVLGTSYAQAALAFYANAATIYKSNLGVEHSLTQRATRLASIQAAANPAPQVAPWERLGVDKIMASL